MYRSKWKSYSKRKFFIIIQEFRLWYQETQCFYYSQTYDLTTSYQRSFLDDQTIPLWKRADERFFWNQPMLSELIDQAEVLHFFYIKKISSSLEKTFGYSMDSTDNNGLSKWMSFWSWSTYRYSFNSYLTSKSSSSGC